MPFVIISSVLLGIRHVRTPLIAGSIWLASAWLLFADVILDDSNPNALQARLVELSRWAGVAGTLAALTLLAFLVGGLVPNALPKRLGRKAERDLTWWIGTVIRDGYERVSWADLADLEAEGAPHYLASDAFYMYTHQERMQIADDEEDGISEEERQQMDEAYDSPTGDDRTDPIPGRWYARLLRQCVDREFPLLRARLLAEHPQTYADLDRKEAEAELRGAITLPLSALVAMGSYLSTWWGLVALVGPAVLYVQGWRIQNQANTDFVQALSSGLVLSPAIEYVRQFNRRPQYWTLDASPTRVRIRRLWWRWGPGAWLRGMRTWRRERRWEKRERRWDEEDRLDVQQEADEIRKNGAVLAVGGSGSGSLPART